MKRYFLRNMMVALFWAIIFLNGIINDSDAQTFKVCIDAGHGGNDPGSCTYIPNCCEDTINLNVALLLRTKLQFAGVDYFYTRDSDEFVDLYDRALMANLSMSKAFISIHHNGSLNPSTQGSETWYCPNPTVTCAGSYYGDPRKNTDTLALKALSRIENAFHYENRNVKDSDFTVLKCSIMHSTLTEASFITEPTEAWAFCNDPFLTHTDLEADALLDAITSFRDNKGFGIIEYEYYGWGLTDYLEVGIDGYIRTVPYKQCWLVGEEHNLTALSGFDEEGHSYYFNRWVHLDPDFGIIGWFMNRDWTFTVDQDFNGIHWYKALYKGGPFALWLERPKASNTEIMRNDTCTISWFAPEGVLSSCSLSVYLTTDNKKTWSKIIGPVKYNYGGAKDDNSISPAAEDANSESNLFAATKMRTEPEDIKQELHTEVFDSLPLSVDTTIIVDSPLSLVGDSAKDAYGKYLWTTPNVTSDSCFLRLIAYDMVDNRDTLISHRFGIKCWRPTADFSANKTTGDPPFIVNFTDLSTHGPTSWSWDFGDGGTSTQKNPSHTYTAEGIFSVKLISTNVCGKDTIIQNNLIRSCLVPATDFYANVTFLPTDSNVYFWIIGDTCYNCNSYIWDYGDGVKDTLIGYGTRHEYDCPGMYTVTLKSAKACSDFIEIKNLYITVYTKPGTPDSDADSIGNNCDNCEYAYNPDQADHNDNGIGDVCDCDSTLGTRDWIKVYNYRSWYNDIQVTPEGGYILLARDSDKQIALRKIDKFGCTQWVQTINDGTTREAHSLCANPDGSGYVIAGTQSGLSDTNKLFVIQVNSAGTVNWIKSYCRAYQTQGYSVLRTPDGGYIIGGRHSAQNDINILLLKINLNGDSLWTRSIGNVGTTSETCHSMQYARGGNFVMGGDIAGTNYYNPYVVNINASGNVIWSKEVKIQPEYYIVGTRDIDTTLDGGYIIGGNGGYQSYDLFLVKLNAVGDTLWSRTYGGPGDDFFHSVRSTPDGGYIIGGDYDCMNGWNNSIWIVKTLQNGDLQWSSRIMDPYHSIGSGDPQIRLTPDNGYIINGAWENLFFVKKLPPYTGSADCVDINSDGTVNILDVIASIRNNQSSQPQMAPTYGNPNNMIITHNRQDINHFLDYLYKDGGPPRPCQ
jgi:N-acetylmuramoyl-L-alanine amidase/PKD repeat protein